MNTACIDAWAWPVKGYGYRAVPVTNEYAHRAAWEDANQACLLPGSVVRHDCDNRACINPKHLQVGRQADNIADMWRRGRQARAHQTRHFGPANAATRLAPTDHAAIRALYKEFGSFGGRGVNRRGGISEYVLATAFGVGQGTINKTLRHLSKAVDVYKRNLRSIA